MSTENENFSDKDDWDLLAGLEGFPFKEDLVPVQPDTLPTRHKNTLNNDIPSNTTEQRLESFESSFKRNASQFKVNDLHDFSKTQGWSSPPILNEHGTNPLPHAGDIYFSLTEHKTLSLVIENGTTPDQMPLPVTSETPLYVGSETYKLVAPQITFSAESKAYIPVVPETACSAGAKTYIQVPPQSTLSAGAKTYMQVAPETPLSAGAEAFIPVDPQTTFSTGTEGSLKVAPETALSAGSEAYMPLAPQTNYSAGAQGYMQVAPELSLSAGTETYVQVTPEKAFLLAGETPLFKAAQTPMLMTAATPLSMNTSEDELKILELLETHNERNSDAKALIKPELPSTAYRIIKCANCGSLFNVMSFGSHICEYDEEQKLINPSDKVPISDKFFKEEPLAPTDHVCFRLIGDNNLRMSRFLKDDLKFDSSTNSLSSSKANGPSTEEVSKKPYNPFECNLCERKFVHGSGLLRHMEKHSMDLIPASSTSASPKANELHAGFKCLPCGRIFFQRKAFSKHNDIHYDDQPEEGKLLNPYTEISYDAYIDDAIEFQYLEANESSIYEETPLEYFKIVILNCVLQCEFCDYVFADLSNLLIHSAGHLPELPFECLSCDITINTAKEIYIHWQAECVFVRENYKHHQATIQRYYTCNVCLNKFQTLYLLHEHRYAKKHFLPRLNQSSAALELPCEFCDVTCKNAKDCISHYDEKHSKIAKGGNKEDKPNTEKKRSYLCDICGKSYIQSGHLWQHLRFHQGRKPFACQEPGCTSKFTIRPDLNDHMRKCHTGERPYHCLICGKRFLTGSVYYQHRLIHRSERRYECEECGKKFYRLDALKNHLRIHSGEKPYGCTFCTKHFRQRGDRDKHIRARHAFLDKNSLHILQLQKIQLEAAAAAAEVVVQQGNMDNPDLQPLMDVKNGEQKEQDINSTNTVMKNMGKLQLENKTASSASQVEASQAEAPQVKAPEVQAQHSTATVPLLGGEMWDPNEPDIDYNVTFTRSLLEAIIPNFNLDFPQNDMHQMK